MAGSFIIGAKRSAVVPHNGAFQHLSIHELGAPVLTAALAQAGLGAEQVDELILSNALGAGGNPARRVALAAGLPERVAGLTIDRQCVGGLDALILADALITSGQCDVVVAGGVETASRRPLRYRTFADGRAPERYDQAPFTPWPERDPSMIEAADRLATKLGISKKEQDDWAIESHKKANASGEGLNREIVGIEGQSKDAFTRVLTPKTCDRSPVLSGDITAANMAVSADAAAFVVMCSAKFATNGNAVRFAGGITIGAEPDLPGTAPIHAVNALLATCSITPDTLKTAEIMEAFAVQAIACQRGAAIPPEIVNRRGGALARGHPIGASGAVLAASLYDQLTLDNGQGLATIAAAGGLGTAVLLES